MIEKQFDISFIANLALHEKQIQQNYRPIIAVHKWFARRPGTLFRGLILSEFLDQPLSRSFYKSNRLDGVKIADPFMGGGTPLVEANRLGCDVLGFDINPMSYWIVKQEIERLDLEKYTEEAYALRERLAEKIGHLYKTQCVFCGNSEADVKYFLWVKSITCKNCGEDIDLFPGYLLATDSRHPKNVFICPECGQLTEAADRRNPGDCAHCGNNLSMEGPAKKGRCVCTHCGSLNTYPDKACGPPMHRLFAMEYFCPSCKGTHAGRFFKVPDSRDREKLYEAELFLDNQASRYIPEDAIPSGDETNRLHRWGYSKYKEMFNARQLAGLTLLAEQVSRISEERIRNALATNFSDLLRYQNMLCRYDSTALKSLDIFSVHGFPVGLIQCESNFLGIVGPDKNTCVGSGGLANITEKFRKAKAYCERPFEIRHYGKKKQIVQIEEEWIGDVPTRESDRGRSRNVELHCGDSSLADIPPRSLDAVFTDPPYFGNVQYAELMDFCYVWLRRLVDGKDSTFLALSTRNTGELTVNEDMGRGIEQFTKGMSAVFEKMGKALKPGAPFVFTYHHNDLSAYHPLVAAILDAGLVCSASFPCPAEMGASIHINGTGSSIVDTIFVCRSTGTVSKNLIVNSIEEVADLVRKDRNSLLAGNFQPTPGDLRCISYGHLARLAVWHLRQSWNKDIPISERLALVSSWLAQFGGWPRIESSLANDKPREFHRDAPLFALPAEEEREHYAKISF